MQVASAPVHSAHNRRTPLVVAGVGAALVAVGVYLVTTAWSSQTTYLVSELADATGSMFAFAVAGPPAGLVVGIVLVALGAAAIGAVGGWRLSRSRGRGRGARRRSADVGRAAAALWRTHRVLVVLVAAGALLAALGVLMISGTATAAGRGEIVGVTSPTVPAL